MRNANTASKKMSLVVSLSLKPLIGSPCVRMQAAVLCFAFRTPAGRQVISATSMYFLNRTANLTCSYDTNVQPVTHRLARFLREKTTCTLGHGGIVLLLYSGGKRAERQLVAVYLLGINPPASSNMLDVSKSTCVGSVHAPQEPQKKAEKKKSCGHSWNVHRWPCMPPSHSPPGGTLLYRHRGGS